MVRTKLKYLVLKSIFIMLLITVVANAETSTRMQDDIVEQKQVLAVMPFVNHSHRSYAITTVMEQLYVQLDSHFVDYISHSELRPILRKYRIRTTGLINRENIEQINNSTEISKILLGSINIYEANQVPEISISIRVLETETMHIIAAMTESATGKDFEKLFGLGNIHSIELLVQKLLHKIIFTLTKDIKNYETKLSGGQRSKTLALIPFDNISTQKKAEIITTNILLSTLVQNGYNLIEPGIVNNIMLKNKNILRGEIDYKTLNQLKEELQIDLLVTGRVENFKFARGLSQAELELGIRTLDASNNKIIFMYNEAIKGHDSESILGFGKINAMGNLLNKTFNNYIQKFEKKCEKYFAKQN